MIEIQEWMRDALRAGRNQSTCLRRRVAALALAVDENGAVVPTLAWNSVVNGEECERCPLSTEAVPPDADYTQPGQRCPALHAEEAAWFQALAEQRQGGSIPGLLLVTEEPCPRCEDLLRRIALPFQVVAL